MMLLTSLVNFAAPSSGVQRHLFAYRRSNLCDEFVELLLAR